MKYLVSGSKIVKNYTIKDKTQTILKGIDINIKHGEFVCIMGPSGSGKSTLLYALSGMDHIDEGSIQFNQLDVTSLSQDSLADLRREQMGSVFQQPSLLKHFNLLDNIMLAAMKEKHSKRKVLLTRAQMLMKQVHIDELQDRDITQVSGGQLQRAGICRALMNHPSIIFADEPTGALNSKTAKDIMNIFSDIHAKGTTILIVTHDANVAARSQRILFMSDGRITQELNLPPYLESNHVSRVQKITQQMQTMDI